MNYYQDYHLEILLAINVITKSTIKNCYVQFCIEYKEASKTSDEDKANNKCLKALTLNKIILYVIEIWRSNNVKSFKVKDLEEMYVFIKEN